MRLVNSRKGRVKAPEVKNDSMLFSQVISTNFGNFPLSIFKKLFFNIKRSLKKQKMVWSLLYLPIYIFTKKTKNSRMGKGRGKKQGSFIHLPVGGSIITITSGNFIYNRIKCCKLSKVIYRSKTLGI